MHLLHPSYVVNMGRNWSESSSRYRSLYLKQWGGEKNQKRRVPQSKKDLFFGTLFFLVVSYFVAHKLGPG